MSNLNNQLEANSGDVKEPAQHTTAIKRSRFSTPAILGTAAVLSILTLLTWYTVFAADKPSEQAPAAMPPIPVETSSVVTAPATREISSVGSLQSNESVLISSEISGRIEKISFAEGGSVKQGESLLRLDSSVLKAELDRAEANRVLSMANFKRAEELLKDHAISRQKRDETYAKWQLDEASIRLAKAQLDKTVISAPFAGTLGLRSVSVGDYIQPGQALVNLEDTETLKVEFSIPEVHSARIAAGQTFSLETDAYPGKSFSGKVYAINPLVNSQSRSMVLRGVIDNSEGLLHPGQFVRIALVTGNQKNALFIPEQAVVPQPKRNFVYKVVDGKVAMTEVSLGKRKKGWVEVTAGLQSGETVVTGGIQKIGDGMPVHAIPADPKLFVDLNEKKTVKQKS